MLYCAADKLFLSADQVLSKISPNVSVWAVEPEQNYQASLAGPGHDPARRRAGAARPWRSVLRIEEYWIKQLADHHEERCGLIAEACRLGPKTSKELVPVVFHKHELDEHQMGFAAGELIAHVNYMLVEGRLTAEQDEGVLLFRSARARGQATARSRSGFVCDSAN